MADIENPETNINFNKPLPELPGKRKDESVRLGVATYDMWSKLGGSMRFNREPGTGLGHYLSSTLKKIPKAFNKTSRRGNSFDSDNSQAGTCKDKLKKMDFPFPLYIFLMLVVFFVTVTIFGVAMSMDPPPKN